MKLTIFIFFTLLLFAVTSCKNNKSNLDLKAFNDTTILDTSKLSSDSNNLQVNKIDTIKYSNLPYWDTTIDRFHAAYIDTFSVDGNRFRFINPVAHKPQLDISVYLEKLVNTKWIYTGFTVGTWRYVGDYYHNRDVNGDGFIDIAQDERFVQAVYFYDPKTKTFLRTTDPINFVENFINPDWELIDTARKIFCDFQMFKGMCYQIHSILYTYHGFKRVDLYELTLYNCTDTNNETNLITKLILSQCINGNSDSTTIIEETKLNPPIDTDGYDDHGNYPNGTKQYFDYKKYWRDKYKKLLGIK